MTEGPTTDAATRPTLRFAPSPNGRLHLGHAYSALLNAEFAQRLGGRLLLRIEDIDRQRSRPELIAAIEADLAWLGLSFDGVPWRQSERFPVYTPARDGLAARGLVYPCFCSRGQIASRIAALEAAGHAVARDPDGTPLYPGTCRALPSNEVDARHAAGAAYSWRLDMTRALATEPGPFSYRRFDMPVSDVTSLSPRAGTGPRAPASNDPRLSIAILADPARWGDVVLARRDAPTSYHLSVVMDDDAQDVTHVVRGQDLEAATDLHVLLQRLLGLSSPLYYHHALIHASDGEKLAKSKGSDSLADLRARGVGPDAVRAMLGFAKCEA